MKDVLLASLSIASCLVTTLRFNTKTEHLYEVQCNSHPAIGLQNNDIIQDWINAFSLLQSSLWRPSWPWSWWRRAEFASGCRLRKSLPTEKLNMCSMTMWSTRERLEHRNKHAADEALHMLLTGSSPSALTVSLCCRNTRWTLIKTLASLRCS